MTTQRTATTGDTPESCATDHSRRPPPLSPMESTYRVEREADQARIIFTGATGLTAPTVLLWAAPILGIAAALESKHAVYGLVVFLVVFFVGGAFVLGRSSSIGSLQNRRAPAGTVVVSYDRLQFPNGMVLRRDDIETLACRNVLDGRLLQVVGGGPGWAGHAATMGAAQHLRDANEILPIAWQIDVHSQGRTFPLVGCMTQATADAVFRELKTTLDFG